MVLAVATSVGYMDDVLSRTLFLHRLLHWRTASLGRDGRRIPRLPTLRQASVADDNSERLRGCPMRAFFHSFGRDPEHDWPNRFSNVRWERLCSGEKMGCSHCFPHGIETSNATWHKDMRCWKRSRQTQWHGFTTKRRAAQQRVRRRTQQRGWYWHRPPKWARRGW